MQALRTAAAAATVAAMALCGGCAESEYRSSGEVEPTNELPNPYQSAAPWGKLPEGRTWGAMNAVAIDNDGESVWVANRCGANPNVPAGQSPFQSQLFGSGSELSRKRLQSPARMKPSVSKSGSTVLIASAQDFGTFSLPPA